jgi:hypothetical protein
MPDLPEDPPCGDVEDGGSAAAKPTDDAVASATEASTTAHSSGSSSGCSSGCSCFDAPERGHANEEEHERCEGRRLEQQQQQQQKSPAESRAGNGWTQRCCCEWAADAFLASLAVTYVVTSVLVVVGIVDMLAMVVPSVVFIVLWTRAAARSPRTVERSLLASVPFFFFDMIHLTLVTGSMVPIWVLVGVWCSPCALAIGMACAYILYAAAMALARAARAAVAAASRSCAAPWAKVWNRRSDAHGNGCDGREPPLPQAGPTPRAEAEHRRRPPSPCP